MTSIRRQLTVRLLVGTLAVVIGAELAVFLYLRGELVEQFDAALLAKARAFGSLIQVDPDGTLDLELSERAMPEYARANAPEYFQVWHADGGVFQRSRSLGGGDLPLQPLAEGKRKRFFDMPGPDGRTLRAVVTRVRPAPDTDERGGAAAPAVAGGPSRADADGPPPPPPPLTVMLAAGRTELDETVAHVMWALLAMAGGLAAAVAAVVTSVVRGGLAPLRELGDAAATIDSETLAYRFNPGDVAAELKPICLRLNDLLARMEETLARERRFTADVAHELRTPVAELRLLAEVALKWPTADPDALARNYADVLEIARRMEAVVASLLTLVRCQSAGPAAALEPLDLRGLAAEAWRGHLPIARQREMRVDVDVPDRLTVRGDRAMLVSLLGNLFGNAVAHAPAGGQVSCTARAGGGHDARPSVLLVLENDNPGLRPEDLEHVWEPFWRKDAARSDGQRCGLGLALVKAYAKALMIGLHVELTSSQRFRVTVLFPDARSGTGNGTPASDAALQDDVPHAPPTPPDGRFGEFSGTETSKV
jgi:signal transduction histidine kinase